MRRKKFAVVMLIVALFVSIVNTGCGDSENMEDNYQNPYNMTVKEATSDFYINDFANLFTEEQKADMMSKAVSLDEEFSGIQVVITTVESLDKTVVEYPGDRPDEFEIEKVGYAMYEQYGIGQDSMGILVLLSVEEGDVDIETGYTMQSYITDSQCKQIIDDYGMDYFMDNQLAEELIAIQNAMIEEIRVQVPKDWNSESEIQSIGEENATGNVQTENADDTQKDSGKFILKIFSWLTTFGIFAAIHEFITRKKLKKQKAEQEKFMLDKQKNLQKINEDLKAECESEISRLNSKYQLKILNLNNEFQDKQRELNSEIAEQGNKIGELTDEVSSLKSELKIQNDKFARIQVLHPEFNFEKEIHEMIEAEFKNEALSLDSELAKVLTLAADKDHIDTFERAINAYKDVSPDVKKYVTTDMQKLESLYDESISLKREHERLEQEKKDRECAELACEKIRTIYLKNSHGSYKTYGALGEAIKIYSSLSPTQKRFFPDNNLLENLKASLTMAQEDYSNRQQARKAEEEVKAIVDRIYLAGEDDREALERAMRFYRNLTPGQAAYFSHDLLGKLRRMLDDAEEDHKRQEDRRRRERMQQPTHNSHPVPPRNREDRGGSNAHTTRVGGNNTTYRSPSKSGSSSSSHNGPSRSGLSSSNHKSSSSRPSTSVHKGHGGHPSGGGAKRSFKK